MLQSAAILRPVAMLWATGRFPWKTKHRAKSWRPAQLFSNIDEEVE
jgi:hypothetical protein